MIIVTINKKEKYFYFIPESINLSLEEIFLKMSNSIDSPLDIDLRPCPCESNFTEELDDNDLRYFNISLFKHHQMSDCTIMVNRIISEMAFNEEYCEFISQSIESISKEDPEFGYELANTIFPKVIKILEDHMRIVTKNFYAYKKISNPNCNNLDADLENQLK